MLLKKIEENLSLVLEKGKRTDSEMMLVALNNLDQLLEKNRGDLHPRLVHYLERRSYSKALTYIRTGTYPEEVECIES